MNQTGWPPNFLFSVACFRTPHLKQFPLAHPRTLCLKSTAVLTEARVRELLAPFGILLTSDQVSQLNAYLDVLLTWNRRINLISVRTPEECVTRHFGESLYLSHCYTLDGRLLDIGSGAGFPGLALKIAFPDLATTLLEPIAKKRAFLKEAVRTCGFSNVDVRPERLEEYRSAMPGRHFDIATCRAVGNIKEICQQMATLLKNHGKVFLWLSADWSTAMNKLSWEFDWQEPLAIPLSRKRKIICGVARGASASDQILL
jgi:16S rRNA (guanine527-N7)-methyltransferase